jgi:DNA helicase-2/ATP-dependent DNA helicase PcrA
MVGGGHLSAFDVARLSARSLRSEHVEDRADGPAAVAAAAGKLGYTIERKPSGDAVLGASDAKLLRDWQAIYVRNDVDEDQAAALIAHELGHLRLHRPQEPCTGADAHAAESRALAKADAYGPSERRELQANVFAREFLLPRSLARQLFLAEHKSASDIAGELKLPPALVRRQLLDSLLGLDVPTTASATPPNSRDGRCCLKPAPDRARPALW